MTRGIERYAALDSPLHRWDPRLKLVGLGALIVAFAVVTELRLVPLLLVVSLALVLLSGLPLRFVLGRLRYPGALVLLLAVILPLLSGPTVLVWLGPVPVRQEGALDFLLIAGKLVAIVMIAVVAFATAPMLSHIRALRALRLPGILADMMLFTYRYLDTLGEDLETMRRAARLRGFRPRRAGRRNVATVGALAGNLLLRSHDQSARVHQAALLRGYHVAAPDGHPFQAGRRDVAALGGTVLVAVGVFLLEVL